MRAALGPAGSTIIKKATRFAVLTPLFFLSQEKKNAIERWLRGREQYRKLRRADCAIVSFGKSGRTWLRVMMSRFFQAKYGLPEGQLISFDNFHLHNSAIPRMFFTHDNYIKHYTGNYDSKVDYAGKKVVLLVRHPADVAVSQYYQWQYRMKPNKVGLNRYPERGQEMPMFDFVTQEWAGLDRTIEFMNGWAEAARDSDDLLVVRYEDMRANPEEILGRVLAFIGSPGSPDEIKEAVEFASFENMRKMETNSTFWLSGGRMKPRDAKNPGSFKTRRGKVGGYRDYFDDGEIAEIDRRIEQQLAPVFGYAGARAAPQAPAA
ncbi:MAG: sulfotransferase domain-containing protein [Pseudomonadota bacterium]